MSTFKPIKFSAWVSLWLMLGLAHMAQAQEVCTLQSPGGQRSCTLSPPFIAGEWNDGKGGVDPDGGSCKKFKNVTYVGDCINGVLDGLVLLKRPFDAKAGNTGGSQYILQIDSGTVRFPIAEYSVNGFEVIRAYDRTGCLLLFFRGKAATSTDPECGTIKAKFGESIASYETWKAVRSGTFRRNDLQWNKEQANESSTAPASPEVKGRDDPKVLGRSARGG